MTCRGPVKGRYQRCYQCARHRSSARAMLADAVAPIAYAVRGGQLAEDLWRYKSAPPDAAAGSRLRALLLAFLRDHAKCVWRAAGMARPDSIAFVPSGQGRTGEHPLRRLALPFLALPEAGLRVRQDHAQRGRDLEPGWLEAGPVAGDVVVIDDTWVSGASAQSAAVALKAAGASRVAIVVIGRHINPADPAGALLASGPSSATLPCQAHVNPRDRV